MTKQDAADFGRTVQLLTRRSDSDRAPIADSVTLHKISGSLHRIAERECNEDLTCKTCGGDGEIDRVLVPGRDITGAAAATGKVHTSRETCPKCKGEGTTTGPRSARLRARAEVLAGDYGLRCYFQTDPRGCALWLIDPATVPVTGSELDRLAYGKPTPHAELQERWIDSNYTRGHAVTWFGR
jgi:hypothetical protein